MRIALPVRASLPLVACQAAAPRPIALFNGEDLRGWHADVPAADQDPQAPPSFGVRDGILVSHGTPPRRGPPADWGVDEGRARRILNLTDGAAKPAGVGSPSRPRAPPVSSGGWS